MKTHSESIHYLDPLEKIAYLAKKLDELEARTAALANEPPAITIDEELATIRIADLALEHGATESQMARRIKKHGGNPIRFGDIWHVRRVEWLKVLKRMEAE